MTPKYPHVTVQLSGRDGNVFAIIGRVKSALKMAGVAREDVIAYVNAAMTAESYDHVLRLTMETVNVK